MLNNLRYSAIIDCILTRFSLDFLCPMIRTRIAPSPTGSVHIGTLRTLLYDYFLARQSGGQVILRIEDTDQKREVEGALEGMLRTFDRMGIDFDEGVYLKDDGTLGQKGPYGPYIQSERLDIYRPYAEKLVAQGDAYYCFCSSETLETMRQEQTDAKQTPKYDRRCMALAQEEVNRRLTSGEEYVIRLKVPAGETSFVDVIRGEITFDNRDVDDQVLLKSDGFPTYHLAVVIDDHLMKISHVLRGEEWLPSTPKHLMLYKMFGWDAPAFAHVPLLLNADKTKLSKRKGDVAAESFLAKGYLPDALFNFLATLGFNPTANRELYSRAELIQLFDLSRVNSGGAVVNYEKLDWMNKEYLKLLSHQEYFALAQQYAPIIVTDDTRARAAFIERMRINRLDELAVAIEEYVVVPELDPLQLIWKKSDRSTTKNMLTELVAFCEQLDDRAYSTPEALQDILKGYIVEKGYETGAVLWPMRVALSHKERSPSPFEYAYVLQKMLTVDRLRAALRALE